MRRPRFRSSEMPVHRILNAAWMVRNYSRGYSGIGLNNRQRAINQLGRTIRDAFANAKEEDYERLLAAILDGLRPRDDRPF